MDRPQTIELQPATDADASRAFEEVKDFGITDMGRGDEYKWAYRILKEPSLTAELRHLANPAFHGRRVESVTFQPCQNDDSRTQDRYHIHEWSNARGKWVFTALFDGHMNHYTVDYAVQNLPTLACQALDDCCQLSSPPPPEVISRVLAQSIISIEASILSDFHGLFPDGARSFMNVSSQQIRQLINDHETGATNHSKVARVLGGTTALITLFNEDTDQLWIANLGDSCAILGSRYGKIWSSSLLNTIQNGTNDSELQRIANEHPGEPECVSDQRVVGWLAPTRALGDAWLKLPAVYTEKIFVNIDAPWMQCHSLDKFATRIKTPPYVSHTPEVHYRKLQRPRQQSDAADIFLITCSDGLVELCSSLSADPYELAKHWVAVIGRALDEELADQAGPRVNLAFSLLRDSIGSDIHTASRILTVEMEDRWVDDTTIIVQRLA